MYRLTASRFRSYLQQSQTIFLGIQDIPNNSKKAYMWFITNTGESDAVVMRYIKILENKNRIWNLFQHILTRKGVTWSSMMHMNTSKHSWRTGEGIEYNFIFLDIKVPTYTDKSLVEFIQVDGTDIPTDIQWKLENYANLTPIKMAAILESSLKRRTALVEEYGFISSIPVFFKTDKDLIIHTQFQLNIDKEQETLLVGQTISMEEAYKYINKLIQNGITA